MEDEPNYCGLPRITELYLPILKWIKIFSGHDIEQDAIVGCGGDNCQEEFGKPPTYTKNIVAVMPKSPTGRKISKAIFHTFNYFRNERQNLHNSAPNV